MLAAVLGPWRSRSVRERLTGNWQGQVRGMNEEAGRGAVPIPADQVDFLIATAARAPSVHNTQP